MKRDIIFDDDGVLFLSINSGINLFLKAIKKCNVLSPNFQTVKKLWGMNLEKSLIPILAESFFWNKDQEKQILQEFYEISNLITYPLQPGLSLALQNMSHERRLGILTNRDLNSLLFRLDEQKIKPEWFVHIHTADNGVSKPDPKVFHQFWNGAGFSPTNTIFIGDSIDHDL